MEKEYRFCYNGTKEMFLNLLRYGSPDKKLRYNESNNQRKSQHSKNYIISTIDDEIKFGIERTGHSGGNWFIPEIVEYEDRIELVGTIQYIGSKDNWNTRSKMKDKVVDVLLHIIVMPFVLIFYCIFKLVDCFKWLIRKTSKKPKQINTKTTEDKLYDLMINYLGCSKV